MNKRRIAILGSTGSIGISTLEIIKKNKSNFLILVDGIIHSEKNNTINALNFKKTEINLSKFKTKSTTFPKLQEKNRTEIKSLIFKPAADNLYTLCYRWRYDY